MSIPAFALEPKEDPYCPSQTRPHVRGKFLFIGDQKFYVCGVTYGPFRPEEDGCQYSNPQRVARDFAMMAANGINAVRTYTVPPRWLLDTAQKFGLRVMVGLPWEQHVTFLDDPKIVGSIEERVREGVRQCAGHPAILCYTVGNEIPAEIVRWLGRRRVEKFIERLHFAAKAEDPGALITYVSFPTTEFLELPFVDLFCFNVYLESQETFEAYLARLQNLVGDRPLMMAEIGLDSRRNGEEAQARSLAWQVRSAFAGGCAGAFAFSWTDEWHRGGFDIEDWDFGLTRRDGTAKPALSAMKCVFSDIPFPKDTAWPRISVVVCTYNGSRTIAETLRHITKLNYPDFEVIVVDDGSTDGASDHAVELSLRLIRTDNRGLSSARNRGLHAATGEIVAYIDDDAYPDPDWLKYLAITFMRGNYGGVGGPNIPPPGDGWIADCVSNSPGGPIHVLLTDREAEHIPGCNMAFRKSALLEVGGFDEKFRTAGDDVDICWSLQQHGKRLGYSPAAVVWHHRRNSVRTYWKQQRGYGRAEALLEKKWPEKYNEAGHVSWAGKIYGNGFFTILPRAGKIYQGPWGTAPFQRLYPSSPSPFSSLMLTPEWYLVIAVLAILTLLGMSWKPLLFVAPLLLCAFGAPVVHALASGWRARFASKPRNIFSEVRSRSVAAILHVAQPIARLLGRIRWGLTPWRRIRGASLLRMWPSASSFWCEEWKSAETHLHVLLKVLQERGAVVHRGGDFDEWDLQIRGGLLGSGRLLMTIEEHGAGRQLLRFRTWNRYDRLGLALTVTFLAVSLGAGLDRAWVACGAVGAFGLILALRTLLECGVAKTRIHRSIEQWASMRASVKLSGVTITTDEPVEEPEAPSMTDTNPLQPHSVTPNVILAKKRSA